MFDVCYCVILEVLYIMCEILFNNLVSLSVFINQLNNQYKFLVYSYKRMMKFKIFVNMYVYILCY